MSKNYEEKKVYYIPAFVERIDELGNYPVKVSFRIGEERLAVQFEDLPDLMFTAEEIAKENDLYTSLHGEVIVVTENKELKAKVASLQEENCNLTAFYNEANKTASEAAEANDELKAKIAELKAEVEDLTGQRDKYKKDAEYFHGEKLTAEENARSVRQENATLTGRNERLESENASLKAERDKFAKTAKDKADLAREAIDHLQEENNKLKREVENRTTDYKLMRDNNAVYLSRIAIRNEVIDALVEKIRRLQGED